MTEWLAFGSPLNLNHLTGFGHDHIHIRFGFTVFDIFKIADWLTFIDTNTYRGDKKLKRVGFQDTLTTCPIKRIDQGYTGAGDSRSTCAAIGLNHVTIDNYRVFA